MRVIRLTTRMMMLRWQEYSPDLPRRKPRHKMKPFPNPLRLPRGVQTVLNQGHQREAHSEMLRLNVLTTQEQEERPGCHPPPRNGEGDHPDSQKVNAHRLWKGAEERRGASHYGKTRVLHSSRDPSLPSCLPLRAILAQRLIALYLHLPHWKLLEENLPNPGCGQALICRR